MALWTNCEWCGRDMVKGKSIHGLEFSQQWFKANRHFCSKRCVVEAHGEEQESQDRRSKGSSCFVATAVYGDEQHPAVIDLRLFRDNWLRDKSFGTAFIKWYYSKGESISKFIEKSNIRKTIAYLLIVKPTHTIVKLFNLK